VNGRELVWVCELLCRLHGTLDVVLVLNPALVNR
jgi:hypothetical protein